MWGAIASFLKRILVAFGFIKIGEYKERAKQAEKGQETTKRQNKLVGSIYGMSRAELVKWMQDNGLVRKADTSKSDAERD